MIRRHTEQGRATFPRGLVQRLGRKKRASYFPQQTELDRQLFGYRLGWHKHNPQLQKIVIGAAFVRLRPGIIPSGSPDTKEVVSWIEGHGRDVMM